MSTQRPSKRGMMRAVGLALGGLAPLVTGIIGLWGYVTRGYIISKTGDLIDGPSGIWMSVFFILVGIGMIVYAIWSCRRQG